MATRRPPLIDCDFPGGNIAIDAIEGDTVLLHQDLRDTEGDWFYWCFRVRGAAGRRLTFRFTGSPAIGTRGPAVSFDSGRHWAWIGHDATEGNTFRFAFSEFAHDVRFSFGMPYQGNRLHQFLERHRGNTRLRCRPLCRTRAGRTVESIYLGPPRHTPVARVLVTCRHHACEMMANYVLEGLLESVLNAATSQAHWLADNIEILAVPFVDKDGVEQGDQGKNRRPHDHNRDYYGDSIYASVRALRRTVPGWSDGRLRVTLDLHCPHISGGHNEDIYMVGSPVPGMWVEQCRFGEILEQVRAGPLPYSVKSNIPYGQAWNKGENFRSGKPFSTWAAELPGVELATSFEMPYATAGGCGEVDQSSARAFGVDLAGALAAYLQQG